MVVSSADGGMLDWLRDRVCLAGCEVSWVNEERRTFERIGIQKVDTSDICGRFQHLFDTCLEAMQPFSTSSGVPTGTLVASREIRPPDMAAHIDESRQMR